MKKKVGIIVLSGFLAVSMAACTGNEKQPSGQETAAVEEQEQTDTSSGEAAAEDTMADAQTSSESMGTAGIGSMTEETADQSEEDAIEETDASADETEETSETTDSAKEETDASIEADVIEETDASGEETATEERELFSGDPLSLSNDSIPYGYKDDDRDENNVPNGVYYYKNLYSKYNADFIQDTSKNVIYLTMDEGYEAGHTPEILDTLKEKNVKAVFFVTKQFVDEHPELVQRFIDEGHIVGNHTCAHPADGMPSLGYEAEKEDITKLHQMVKDQFGYEMKLFRYPSGISSEQSMALVQSLGYKSVFWSFAHHDWVLEDQPDEQESLQKCLNSIHPGAIYLLHAVSATNTHIMADFIDGAREKGYEFGVYPVDN